MRAKRQLLGTNNPITGKHLLTYHIWFSVHKDCSGLLTFLHDLFKSFVGGILFPVRHFRFCYFCYTFRWKKSVHSGRLKWQTPQRILMYIMQGGLYGGWCKYKMSNIDSHNCVLEYSLRMVDKYFCNLLLFNRFDIFYDTPLKAKHNSDCLKKMSDLISNDYFSVARALPNLRFECVAELNFVVIFLCWSYTIIETSISFRFLFHELNIFPLVPHAPRKRHW